MNDQKAVTLIEWFRHRSGTENIFENVKSILCGDRQNRSMLSDM